MNMKFFNYKTGLSILIFTTLWIILSVELSIIPLFSSGFTNEFIDKLNKVLVNISYSVLAAFIFYWFTFVLPKKILIYRSKKILAHQVHTLLYELFVLINKVFYAYTINKGIEEIEEKDLLHINGNLTKGLKGFYSTSEHCNLFWKKGKKITGFGDMPFSFPDDIYVTLKKTPTLINKIRMSNPNFHVDEEFAEVIASIETNKMLEIYSDGKCNLFLYGDSSKFVYSLISDYKRLLSLKYHKKFRNSYQKIHFYSNEEINAIPLKRQQYFNELAPKSNFSKSLNPCIIFSPKYVDSRAVISGLNDGAAYGTKVFSLIEYMDNITIPCNCSFIVIIGHDIPNKKIQKFIKSNINDKAIIWLKPSFYKSTNKIITHEVMKNFGLYKMYFRKPFIFWHFNIWNKQPTREQLHIIRCNISLIMMNLKQD